MKKISFDFDSTLDTNKIFEFAKQLGSDGEFELWIVTTRLDQEHAPSAHWNDDLFSRAMKCRIPFSNIHFTNGGDKWLFFKDKDFLFHIDDDWLECDLINEKTNCKGIKHFGNPNWKDECLELMKI